MEQTHARTTWERMDASAARFVRTCNHIEGTSMREQCFVFRSSAPFLPYISPPSGVKHYKNAWKNSKKHFVIIGVPIHCFIVRVEDFFVK